MIDDKIVKRAYSIASISSDCIESWLISFCIKRVEWWVFSSYTIDVMQIGETLTLQWPAGRMVYTPTPAQTYLLISVGSGLSPLYSIYNQLVASRQYSQIYHLFGERYISHIPQTIQEILEVSHDHIWSRVYLSREDKKNLVWHPWLYHHGYVQAGLHDILPTLPRTDIQIYICGKPTMVDDVTDILLASGYDKAYIHSEKY
jgi:ferredoxin-NADP reductase